MCCGSSGKPCVDRRDHAGDFVLARKITRLRSVAADFPKTHGFTRPALRQAGQVDRGDLADARVTAECRMFGHQSDWLAAGGKLHGAGRYRLADQLQRRGKHEAWAVEAESDPVGIGCDAELRIEQRGARSRIERIEMRAADQPDRLRGIGVEPRPRIERPGRSVLLAIPWKRRQARCFEAFPFEG